MDRRTFTNASVMALLSGLTVTITGCAETETPSSPSTPSPGTGTRTATISENHSHSASVTSAQIEAGNEITVTVRGTADHAHTVVLTMGDLMTLGAGQSVTKEATSAYSPSYGDHGHTVTFS